MTNHTKLILFKIGLTIFIFCCFLFKSKGTEFTLQEDILKSSLGQIQSWDENPYLLFSCRGDNFQNIFIHERTFLIDKENKNVRLETVDNNQQSLVIFFNYENQKINKIYLNNVDISDKKDTYGMAVLKQFQEDCKKLLLPIFLSKKYPGKLQYEQKIVEGERIYQVKFNNFSTWNINIAPGYVYLNSKYEIIKIITDNENLTVSNQKDIGAGIILPSDFRSNDDSKNIIFTTVAAFMSVDQNKFIHL